MSVSQCVRNSQDGCLPTHGYSYAEICELCGWTYTKVNRSLAEGRARLRGLVVWEAE
jgi:hypothetical protein